jgi:hypothetical protein
VPFLGPDTPWETAQVCTSRTPGRASTPGRAPPRALTRGRRRAAGSCGALTPAGRWRSTRRRSTRARSARSRGARPPRRTLCSTRPLRTHCRTSLRPASVHLATLHPHVEGLSPSHAVSNLLAESPVAAASAGGARGPTARARAQGMRTGIWRTSTRCSRRFWGSRRSPCSAPSANRTSSRARPACPGCTLWATTEPRAVSD